VYDDAKLDPALPAAVQPKPVATTDKTIDPAVTKSDPPTSSPPDKNA